MARPAEQVVDAGADQPRLVLDTNTFVAAAFSPGSASGAIVAALRDGRFQLVWNEATLRETRRIMQRIPPIEWSRFEGLFDADSRFEGAVDLEGVSFVPDPEDRKFAALAAAASATLITNDDDLLSVQERLSIPVYTPSTFRREYLP